MDVGIIVALVMLVIWAFVTFFLNDAPGITHALLTAGIALLIWRIVARSERNGSQPRA